MNSKTSLRKVYEMWDSRWGLYPYYTTYIDGSDIVCTNNCNLCLKLILAKHKYNSLLPIILKNIVKNI